MIKVFKKHIFYRKTEAGNESVIEANVDLPGREQVEYIEKTVMNAIGTANTPPQSLEVLGFAQVSAGIAEGSVTIGIESGTPSSGSGVTKPPVGIGRYLGYKRYELTNHLGNVLATISDFRKTSFTGTTINYFKPDVRSVSDHYPFGMLMPGRQVNPTEYLYGFNGKEKDDEIKGNGNSLDFGNRMYDPRIARFFSIDREATRFSHQSPYSFAGNNPILNVDFMGDSGTIYIQILSWKGKPVITPETADLIKSELEKVYSALKIDVKIEIHFSNEIIGLRDFYRRKGAHNSDSYVIIGKDYEQNLEAAKKLVALKWEDPEVDPDDAGSSACRDKLSLINAENIMINDCPQLSLT